MTNKLSPVDGLAQLTFLVQATLEGHATAHDLSMTSTRLLGILRDREPTMQQLANLLDLDKSSVTGLVARAERRGLVTRTPSVADRRVVTVQLTEAGRALVTEVAGRFGADMAQLLKALPKQDRQTFSDLTARLVVAHASARGLVL